jgi:taurine dioxygenase
MKILPSAEANSTQRHPLVRTHPETGQRSLFVNQVYTVGLEGPDLDTDQASALLKQLCEHATQDQFVYRHRWQPDMLIVWDNRCVQHSAQGGYDGHRRLMHRTTVAGEAPVAA